MVRAMRGMRHRWGAIGTVLLFVLSTTSASKAISQTLYKVKIIPNVRVTMRDGVEIAAKIMMPEAKGKFPAVMSYDPYSRVQEVKPAPSELEYSTEHNGSYFLAQHGYVTVDYDARGTHNSGGSTQEMYADAERRDGYDMVEWIAAQPWSNGNVGMWGISYGAVDTWQVAAQNPPHLKAIIVRAGTDDVYGDWMYPGGVLRPYFIFGNYVADRVSDTFAPPDPDIVGEKWASLWQEHLRKNAPWSIGFLEHQFDHSYWRARSVWPNYDRIKCAVFVIGGWADWYTTAELRAFSHLKVPKRALIGPWGHYWPEVGIPGPRIDGRPEYLKWFDQFLKGVDTGVLKEPPVTIWVRKYQPPAPMYLKEEGFWRQESNWPLARTEYMPMYLSSEGKLGHDSTAAENERGDSYTYNPSVGVMDGILGRGNIAPWAMPLDQRLDEAYSLTYTAPPLGADLEVTGNPSVDLFVSSTADVAFFEVKICDVAPDGVSKLITEGGLNATHRFSRSNPEPLKPGEVTELKFNLKSMAYIFPPGHRIRVDVSSADFQNHWPVSKAAVNTIYHGGKYRSHIILPVAPVQNPKLTPPNFRPSPNPLPDPDSIPKPEYNISYDLIRQTTTLNVAMQNSVANASARTSYTVFDKDPARVVIKSTAEETPKVGNSDVKMETQCVTDSNATAFNQMIEIEITVEGKRYFNKNWTITVPRKLN